MGKEFVPLGDVPAGRIFDALIAAEQEGLWRRLCGNAGRLGGFYLPEDRVFGFYGYQDTEEQSVIEGALMRLLVREQPVGDRIHYCFGIPPIPFSDCGMGWKNSPGKWYLAFQGGTKRGSGSPPRNTVILFPESPEDAAAFTTVARLFRARLPVEILTHLTSDADDFVRAVVAVIRRLWPIEKALDLTLYAFAQSPARITLRNELQAWLPLQPVTPWRQALMEFLGALSRGQSTFWSGISGSWFLVEEMLQSGVARSRAEADQMIADALAKQILPGESVRALLWSAAMELKEDTA